jgi:hypothetical protein
MTTVTLSQIEDELRHVPTDKLPLVYKLVRELSRTEPTGPHPDLEALAGTWTPQETEDFLKAIKDFETVDARLWQ